MILENLFWLVALHFLADFQLQTDFIASRKAPGSYHSWPWVMSAHAAAHGAAVALILGPVFGLIEFVAHWLVDVAKAKGVLGQGRIGMCVDQSLHLGMKGIWVGLSLVI